MLSDCWSCLGWSRSSRHCRCGVVCTLAVAPGHQPAQAEGGGEQGDDCSCWNSVGEVGEECRCWPTSRHSLRSVTVLDGEKQVAVLNRRRSSDTAVRHAKFQANESFKSTAASERLHRQFGIHTAQQPKPCQFSAARYHRDRVEGVCIQGPNRGTLQRCFGADGPTEHGDPTKHRDVVCPRQLCQLSSWPLHCYQPGSLRFVAGTIPSHIADPVRIATKAGVDAAGVRPAASLHVSARCQAVTIPCDGGRFPSKCPRRKLWDGSCSRPTRSCKSSSANSVPICFCSFGVGSIESACYQSTKGPDATAYAHLPKDLPARARGHRHRTCCDAYDATISNGTEAANASVDNLGLQQRRCVAPLLQRSVGRRLRVLGQQSCEHAQDLASPRPR